MDIVEFWEDDEKTVRSENARNTFSDRSSKRNDVWTVFVYDCIDYHVIFGQSDWLVFVSSEDYLKTNSVRFSCSPFLDRRKLAKKC